MSITTTAESQIEALPGPVWAFAFSFKAFGVSVRVECTDRRSSERAYAIAHRSFVGRIEAQDENDSFDYSFGIATTDSGRFQLWENGRFRSDTDDEDILFRFFTGYLRVIVAERALDFVFIHAGVVGYRGHAIVIPVNSFSGKTTLVAELEKRGAEYFSDEYALIDACGAVHPYPRDLSIRLNGDRENPILVTGESLGSVSTEPAEVGLVLVTEFRPGSVWTPEILSTGNGMKEMIPHTIPIRLNTAFSMKVLKAVATRAIILKGSRPDARLFARTLLSFIDNDLNWSAMT